jgi:MraZ protein
MSSARPLIVGEFRRSLDERFRLSLPSEWTDGGLLAEGGAWILAKERFGALSLWEAAIWQSRLDEALHLVRAKMDAGRLADRLEEVQRLGRLLSTRQVQVQLAGKGRLLLPTGFREFLGVEPGGEIVLVGAAICVEIWRPEAWLTYLAQHMADFGSLLDRLSN